MKIAVIGAGWAGMAAAVQLAQTRQHQVSVFEASRTLGGRARALDLPLPDGQTLTADNGQHILDVTGLAIADPLAFETEVNQWAGVITVGIFAHQKAVVCLLGTELGVQTLEFV